MIMDPKSWIDHMRTGRHIAKANAASPEAAVPPPATDPSCASLTDAAYLPNGNASSLLEISTALDGTAHDDLVRRPALEIAQALRMMNPEFARTNEQVAQFLACVNAVLNKLYYTVELLSQGLVSLPGNALLNQDAILAAAHKLSKMLRDRTPAQSGEKGCAWERSILKLPCVSRAPTASHVDPVQAAFDVLQTAPAQDSSKLSSPRSAPEPTPAAHLKTCSPHLYLKGSSDGASVEGILPKGLQQAPIHCRVPIGELLEMAPFTWPPKTPYFSIEQWNVPVFDPVADAAAQKVTAGLQGLAALDQTGEVATVPEVDPEITEPAARRMIQQLLRRDAVRDARLTLETQVHNAKVDYCHALLDATALPVAQMIQASFIESLKQAGELDAERKPSVKRSDTLASGRCPLRSALLASRTKQAGPLPLPETQPRFEQLDPTRSAEALASYNQFARMVVPVRGKCPECGKEGKCYMQNGMPGCVKGAGLPVIEKKAHIIPHAAAACRETALLLHHIDGPNPPPCGWHMAKYLALPHNIFFMSTCFESFFDDGSLVLVKIGPPEFQFYRVTTTPRAQAAVIDFGVDLEMRALFEHIEAPVRLSCINGLVVDLARPAKVMSGGVEHHVPRVSHRYLDLHARAHYPALLQRPLVSHQYMLSGAALNKLEQGFRRRYPDIDTTVNAATVTIHEWLDALARQPGPPPATASP